MAEAERLIDMADRYGVTLMVGHTFEFSPPVVKIKEIIESGALGDIYYVSAIRVNLGIHQKDVSVVWDLARTISPCCSTGWTKLPRRSR